MGAPKGNKNAAGHKGVKPERWTLEFFTKELAEIKKYLETKEGKFFVFIMECCLQRGYSSGKWSEMRNKFKDNLELQEAIKSIEEILEVRLYKAGLTNKVNPTMAIAGLNNKYRWANKYQTDLTTKGESINLSNYTEEEKQQLLKLARKSEYPTTE